MNNSLVYLAVPYTHPKKFIMTLRHVLVTQASVILMEKYNQPIFSPITHSHAQSEIAGTLGTWDFWQHVDTVFLKKCDEVWVLMLSGWEKSVGVLAEIEIADKIGIPVKFINLTHKGEYLFVNPIEPRKIINKGRC